MSERTEIARGMYRAFAEGDRAFVERVLGPDLRFSSPVDVGLDRAGYFDRCWPGAGQRQHFDFVRLLEADDEVIVTYVMSHPDGRRGQNTEILRFEGDRIREVEVYFGWSLPPRLDR